MNRKLCFREALKQVCAARIYRNAPLGDENVNGFARRADGAYAVLDHRDARAGEVGRDDGHLCAGRSVAVTARTPMMAPAEPVSTFTLKSVSISVAPRMAQSS